MIQSLLKFRSRIRKKMLQENKDPLYVSLSCYVQPKSSRCAIIGIHDGMLKIALTAPPVEGEANKMLIKCMASWLGVSKSSCTLAQGDSSRRKVVRVSGINAEDVKKRLQANVNFTIN